MMVAGMEAALRKELAAMFEVRDLDPEEVEQYRDHQNRCEVFIYRGNRARISDEAMRVLCPPVDPFVEAFAYMALAIHEREKRDGRR